MCAHRANYSKTCVQNQQIFIIPEFLWVRNPGGLRGQWFWFQTLCEMVISRPDWAARIHFQADSCGC